MFQDLRNESLGFFRKVLLQKMEPKWGDPKTKFLRLSKKTLLPIISCQFLVIFLFFCWNLLQIYCFFRFFAAKMLKITIFTSVWCAQHPNACRNIQQMTIVISHFSDIWIETTLFLVIPNRNDQKRHLLRVVSAQKQQDTTRNYQKRTNYWLKVEVRGVDMGRVEPRGRVLGDERYKGVVNRGSKFSSIVL